LIKIGLPLFLTICQLAITSYSQERKTVVWSGDPGCGWKNATVEPADSYVCGVLTTPRGNVSTVSHKNISLLIAFLEHDQMITVAVQISNESKEPLIFDTDNWGAAHFRERSDFFAGKKPLVAETSIPTRDFSRQLAGRARSDNSIDEYLAEVQQTVEVVEIRRPDGTKARVKRVVPDVEEQQAAESRSESRTMMARNNSEQLRQNALTVKTVSPEGSVKGLVYFRRLKAARFVVFSFALDDTSYLFLLPRSSK